MKYPFFDRIGAVISKMLSAFFVRKCAMCSEVLWEKVELCEECLSLWRTARSERCPICAKTARYCGCRPVLLTASSRVGKNYITSLVFYGKADDERKSNILVRGLIRKLKESSDRGIVKFVSRELSAQVLRFLKTQGEDTDDWTICYPPRSPSRKRQYGFDQGREIAETVSKYTGIVTERCFERRTGELQKTLNFVERRKNAEDTLILTGSTDPLNKKYIIIDDVITTGATVNAASKLLLEAGANKVYPVCVARAKKKKRKVKRRVAQKLWFK